VGRKATGFKRLQSRIANGARRAILRDGTRDTGCGLKAFRRDVFLALPYFDALHRFLPALVRREGYRVAYVDVIDRPRLHGVSNYGLWDRLWVGILDVAGVWWLIRRRKRVPLVLEVCCDAGLSFSVGHRLSAERFLSGAELVGVAWLRRTVTVCDALHRPVAGVRAGRPQRDAGGVLVLFDGRRHVDTRLCALQTR